MFLTGGGSVLGAAEMLCPVNEALQPFRFISLATADRRRLGSMIWERSTQNKIEQAWIEKLRAASAGCGESQSWRFGRAEGLGLLTLSMAAATYLMSPGLLQ
jgi:hypothetical protein